MQIARDILSVAPDSVPDFIARHAGARTLSGMVRSLNCDLLHGDPGARRLAARALDHLGFVVHD